MTNIERRDFLKGTAAIGAGLAFPTIIPSSVWGDDAPSKKVGIGMISCGARAGYAGMYPRHKRAQIVAVCDPIKSRRDKCSKRFKNAKAYNDFRELLANKDVDGVHIATPDHWHVPIALLAAKAGKDMYTEKPLGICINQDLKAREIVDKYKRVFQYGAQQRSLIHVRLGIELVLNGHIGELKECFVWAPCGTAGGNPTEQPVPADLDYDMWLGPAPKKPYCRDRVFGGGRWYCYDYAIGFIAGWGAHPMDMLQWYLDNAGMPEIPVKYEGTGRIPTKGLFDTVTNWDVHCTYANGLKMRFMDNQTASKKKPHPAVGGGRGSGHGTLFVGSEGWVEVNRGGWKTSTDEIRKKAKNPGKKRLKASRDQIHNFVDCMISRETPVDDLHSAVRSDVATHLAEIAVRTRKPVQWDPKKETIVGNPEGIKMMDRPMRTPWTV